MVERSGWLERALTGGPLLVLAVFLCYTVAITMVMTPVKFNQIGGPVVVLGTLPLLWVGGRTFLGRSSRGSRLLVSVWAIGVVAFALSQAFWMSEDYDFYAQYVPEVPTYAQVEPVSGVLVIIAGLASLGYWVRERLEAPAGSATRTDEGAENTTTEPPQLSTRRTLLSAAVAVWTASMLVGSMIVGSGLPQKAAPGTAFDFEYRSDGRVTVTHTGGATLRQSYTDSLTVIYTDTSGTEHEEVWADDAGAFPIEASDTYTTTHTVEPGTFLRILWTAPGGDRAGTVGVFEVPA